MAMDWMAKARAGVKAPEAAAPKGTASKSGPSFGTSSAVAATSANVRPSNGLKEFLWLTSDLKEGRILDLGPAFQTTVMFFIEKGFRLSTEDMLRSWKEFITAEEESLRSAKVGREAAPVSQALLAEKFLETSLQYPEDHFNGILAWDLFDYLDGELLPRVMDRLYSLLAPGGSFSRSFIVSRRNATLATKSWTRKTSKSSPPPPSPSTPASFRIVKFSTSLANSALPKPS